MGKTRVELELFNTYSRILSETCPRCEYRSGHLHLYRNVGGTSDSCRACVLVLAAMQNVLTRCRLLYTNIEFIMYPDLHLGWRNTDAGTDARRKVKYLRMIHDNKRHLIRNRRDPFALLLIIAAASRLSTVFSVITRNECKIAMSLLNVTRLNTQLIRESGESYKLYASVYVYCNMHARLHRRFTV